MPNHSDNPMSPERIERIRAARGWTQQQLADACGTDLRTVQRWLFPDRSSDNARAPRGPSAKLLELYERQAPEKRK